MGIFSKIRGGLNKTSDSVTYDSVMMDFSIRENTVQIGAAEIAFPHDILAAQVFGDLLILVLAIPHDCHDTDNVYAVDQQCRIVWQIQSRDALGEPHSMFPYVGVSVEEERFRAIDFYGARYFFDPQTGALIGRDRNGRDW